MDVTAFDQMEFHLQQVIDHFGKVDQNTQNFNFT